MSHAAAAGEFDLIARLRRATRVARADVVLGIGDDGAVLRVPRGRDVVVVMDTLVDGVHFPRDTDPAAIGWKALAVNLSDLAAMGAEPAWATLALTLPTRDAAWLAAFARGYARLARRHRVALVGGDTTRGPLTVTLQAHGFVPPRRALTRDGARVGDSILVSGSLGDAAAGLAIAQGRLVNVGARDAAVLRARLDLPTPRVALGLALRGIASAAIDVSDGFAQDLGHVLAASGVGAEISLASLPASAALRRAVPEVERRLRWQLSGGDDYELCFTASPRQRARLAALARHLRLPLTEVGVITRARGLRLRDDEGQLRKVDVRGYDHFA